MTFRNLLESTKFTGKIKPYEKLLYSAYIDFLQEYFKTNINLTLHFVKPSNKDIFGDIDIKSLEKKKYKINVENGISSVVLGRIAHEFTHIYQYLNNSLSFSSDEKYLMWNGKDFMSIKEYNSITNFQEYKKIPWEAESYKMQNKLPNLFKKSKYYKDLKGKDISLDFLMDNS